jgi:maltooligosyltrehalose trehalohydrolase
MDAQWLDDFHHALHSLLTGEREGYYQDFGSLEHLARAYQRGYVYAGEHSMYRRRRHGTPGDDVAPKRFVTFLQNHDQVGNRMLGDRLSTHLSREQYELAAAAVLLGPSTPLLFMGEEYGEQAPFPYFVSHTDEALVEAVRRGRAEEFAGFAWSGEPPDPQAESTFESAVLDWSLRERDEHAAMLALYTALLRVRREMQPLRPGSFAAIETRAEASTLRIVTRAAGGRCALYLHFDDTPVTIKLPDDGTWRLRLDTAARRRSAPAGDVLRAGAALEMAPWSAVLLSQETHA